MTEPLFTGNVFKATRLLDLVVKRTLNIYYDRIVTQHDNKEPANSKDTKAVGVDEGCSRAFCC